MNATDVNATNTSTIKRIGVLAHPLRPRTFPLSKQLIQMLDEHDVETWVYTRWRDEDVEDAVRGSDMVIAIGGDGAMLRAARVCARFDVPVLGINTGQLGFLTEINDIDLIENELHKVMDGDYWIEKRMMIHASVKRNGETIIEGRALNDIVVSANVFGKMIQLETYIDDDWATSFSADALVIATATGSTAYALSLGGPILPPELRNILIIPAAPHLSMERPMVLAEGAQVEVRIAPNNRNLVMIACDGSVLQELSEDDVVCIRAADHVSRFVRLRSRNYFYRSLLDRLEPRYQYQKDTRNGNQE